MVRFILSQYFTAQTCTVNVHRPEEEKKHTHTYTQINNRQLHTSVAPPAATVLIPGKVSFTTTYCVLQINIIKGRTKPIKNFKYQNTSKVLFVINAFFFFFFALTCVTCSSVSHPHIKKRVHLFLPTTLSTKPSLLKCLEEVTSSEFPEKEV